MSEITDPEESRKAKALLLLAEAKAFVKQDILDRVDFYINDGRIAERVLSKGNIPVMEVK
jgi:hypothetical protein